MQLLIASLSDILKGKHLSPRAENKTVQSDVFRSIEDERILHSYLCAYACYLILRRLLIKSHLSFLCGTKSCIVSLVQRVICMQRLCSCWKNRLLVITIRSCILGRSVCQKRIMNKGVLTFFISLGDLTMMCMYAIRLHVHCFACMNEK